MINTRHIHYTSDTLVAICDHFLNICQKQNFSFSNSAERIILGMIKSLISKGNLYALKWLLVANIYYLFPNNTICSILKLPIWIIFLIGNVCTKIFLQLIGASQWWKFHYLCAMISVFLIYRKMSKQNKREMYRLP